MNEDTACVKPTTRIEQILNGLNSTQERRQKIINIIGEIVGRLHPIEQKPTVTEERKELVGTLGDIDVFIEILSQDNDSLSAIAETLQKIL